MVRSGLPWSVLGASDGGSGDDRYGNSYGGNGGGPGYGVVNGGGRGSGSSSGASVRSGVTIHTHHFSFFASCSLHDALSSLLYVFKCF